MDSDSGGVCGYCSLVDVIMTVCGDFGGIWGYCSLVDVIVTVWMVILAAYGVTVALGM